MELRLFNRGKDIRFVRPHRIAFLEWFRGVRHNIFCEVTLMFDTLRERFQAHKITENEPVTQELFPVEKKNWTQKWLAKLRELLNGRRAALFTRTTWETLRTQGVKRAFWPLLFLLGVALGFGIKTWAEDSITIGYDDYKLEKSSVLYDLNALETKFLADQENPVPSDKKVYPACSLE